MSASGISSSSFSPYPLAPNPSQQAYRQLGQDLKSGNLSTAQKDFFNLQPDVRNAGGAVNRFHNHHQLRSEIGTLASSASALPSATASILAAAQAHALQPQPPVPGGGVDPQTEPPVYGAPSSVGGLFHPEPPELAPLISLVA